MGFNSVFRGLKCHIGIWLKGLIKVIRIQWSSGFPYIKQQCCRLLHQWDVKTFSWNVHKDNTYSESCLLRREKKHMAINIWNWNPKPRRQECDICCHELHTTSSPVPLNSFLLSLSYIQSTLLSLFLMYVFVIVFLINLFI